MDPLRAPLFRTTFAPPVVSGIACVKTLFNVTFAVRSPPMSSLKVTVPIPIELVPIVNVSPFEILSRCAPAAESPSRISRRIASLRITVETPVYAAPSVLKTFSVDFKPFVTRTVLVATE